mgnify:CR=1 FL=1
MEKYNVFDCSIIELDKHHSDRKGNLTVVQNGDILKSRYENYLKFVRGEEWQYHVHTYQVMIKKK